jgi:hypothetical protein
MKTRFTVTALVVLACVLTCAFAAYPTENDREGKLKRIAWRAYADATGNSILAEEGPHIVGEFILDRDIKGLGKKEDRIHEVRFARLGGLKVRGLIFVNGKTGQSLVVFPRKALASEHGAATDPGPKDTSRRPHFAIAGTADMDGDGKSDNSLIRELISTSGGVIDAELDIQGILTCRLLPETQYLILGKLPLEKDAPPDVLRKYIVFLERAHGLGIQVITPDGLLRWGTRARQRQEQNGKGGPSAFRDRQPPSRGSGSEF